MEERSLRTANAVLDEPEEPEDPVDALEFAPPERADEVLPLVADAPEPDDPEEPEDPLSPEALVVPLAETTSPTWPERVTIVPSWGAKSLVSATASSSVLTVSSSLFTAAPADARLASRVAALRVEVEEELDVVELEEPELEELGVEELELDGLGVEEEPVFEDWVPGFACLLSPVSCLLSPSLAFFESSRVLPSPACSGVASVGAWVLDEVATALAAVGALAEL